MFYALALATGITALVCWIMVLIQIFKSGQTGLGILGIFCPLFTFIYGWMKAKEFGIKNIMIIWSVAVVLSVVVNLSMSGSVVTVNGR